MSFRSRLLRYVRQHHLALVALFVALGGVSYAATQLPKNSVGQKQLKANAVVSSKVKNGSLRRGDFGAGQIPAGPQGSRGPTGPTGSGATGPTGPGGAPTITRRIGTEVFANPDNGAIAEVSCEANEVAVGGGGTFWNGHPADPILSISMPLIEGAFDDEVGSPTGWRARFWNRDANNDDTGTIGVRAYVLCAPAAP